MNFLVVDDSKYTREGIVKFLNKLGHTVTYQAEDRFKAVEAYKNSTPDIITIDLEMPDMRGTDTAKIIFSLNPNAKIIIITSNVDKKIYSILII